MRPHKCNKVSYNSEPNLSKSWCFQKALCEKSKDPKYVADEKKLKNFRWKIRRDNEHAQFNSKSVCSVWCSKCESTVTMRYPFDLKNWTIHWKGKRCSEKQKSTLSSTQITSYLSRPKPRRVSASVVIPCPGLTASSNKRVACYLQRFAAPGGGAPSRSILASHLFGKKNMRWLSTTLERQKIVLCQEEAEFQWQNIRGLASVFSTRCKRQVQTLDIRSTKMMAKQPICMR